MMTHVSLFTGIGGLDLAAEAAGFATVLQVEREPYALQILERHWPNVPRITDVREVHDDERWTQPTVVSGGFPCQPFSAAGKRRGSDDDRYLWPELLRIVEELQPTWVVGENVSGLLSIDDGMEIDRLLASLEVANYTPWVLHYPAAGVGAYHRRDRVFIVAHCNSRWELQPQRSIGKQRGWTGNGGKDVAYTNSPQRQRGWIPVRAHAEHAVTSEPSGRRTQSGVGRVADGLPNWVDGEPVDIPRVATKVLNRAPRLKALGNAVVPAQAYPIFAAIAEAENARH